MPKSPDPSGNVAFIIYMHKDFLPVTFSPGLDLFGFHSQEPSRNVTGRKSVCIYIFYGTFPLGSGFFGIHSQEPSRKVRFSFSRHSAPF